MTSPHQPGVDPAQTRPATPVVTFHDLVEDLLWPKLLRAPRLALHPDRLFLASLLMLVVLIANMISVGMWRASPASPRQHGDGFIADSVTTKLNAMMDLASSLFTGDMDVATASATTLLVDLPNALLENYPWWGVLPLIVVIAAAWSVLGGAIARMTAMEFSLGIRASWPEGVGFAAGNWKQLIAAQLGPAALVGLVVLGMAATGWVLFVVPIANLVGGLAFIAFVIVGVLAVLLMLASLMSATLLVPAVACEGTDAIDAAQRCIHYVLHTPLRWVAYVAVLLLVCVPAGSVVWLVAWGGTELAQGAASMWLPDARSAVFASGAELGTTDAIAAGLVRMACAIPLLLAGAFVINMVFTGSTLLYLCLRQLNDGQDWAELWMPGMIEGTITDALGERHTSSEESDHA